MRLVSAVVATLVSAFSLAQNADIDWLTFPAAHNIHEGQKGVNGSSFAVAHNVDLGMSEAGSYEYLSDGSFVWSVGLSSESSVSINASLTDVHLCVGDELVVSTPDGSFRQAFSHADVSSRGYFQSPVVPGSQMLITLSGRNAELSTLRIATVNVGFVDIDVNASSTTLKAGYGASRSCEVNASCDPLVDDIRYAVCRLTANGKQYGTGTLVNNTAHDGTPYIITAAHVFSDDLDDIKSLVVLFNFDTMVCQKMQPNKTTVVSTITDYDAEMVAFNETSDLALVRLSKKPSDVVSPYWVGWDRSAPSDKTAPASPYRVVHHPGGDVRKVSVSEEDLGTASYTSDVTATGKQFEGSAHWRLYSYTSGVTEGGSSGASLLDANGRILGCLTGGAASCDDPRDDFYWRLDYNWDALSPYLDPLKTGATTLDGQYFYTDKYVNLYNIACENNVICAHLSDRHGYLAGHNDYGTSQLAQQLGKDGDMVEVEGMYLSPYIMRTTNANSFTIKLWGDDNGVPGKLLASRSYKNTVISAKNQSYLAFDKSTQVTGKFFVGVELSYPSTGVDSVAFYYAPGGSSARFYSDGKWHNASYYGADGDVDLFFGARCRLLKSASGVTEVVSPSWTLMSMYDGEYAVNADEMVSVDVHNVSGKRILALSPSLNPVVSLSAMPSGIYIISVRSSSGRKSFKVVNR